MGRSSLMVDVLCVLSDWTMRIWMSRPNSAKICLQLPQGETKSSLQINSVCKKNNRMYRSCHMLYLLRYCLEI